MGRRRLGDASCYPDGLLFISSLTVFFIEQLFVFAFAFLPDSVISLCVSHFCPLCTLQ